MLLDVGSTKRANTRLISLRAETQPESAEREIGAITVPFMLDDVLYAYLYTRLVESLT